MHRELLIALTGIISLAVLAHLIAWKLRRPSILIFLLFGFLAGPVFHLIDIDHVLGELLFPIVSLSIAIILFEGGLTLRFADLRQIELVVWRILSVGVLATWALTTLLALVLLNFSFQLALFLGAMLVVTGPTVIIPLLRQIRPSKRAASILRWEGIVIDPIGVVLTLLIFEAITDVSLDGNLLSLLVGLGKTLVIGLVLGYITPRLLIEALRRHWIPDYLENPITLFLVILAFTLSDVLQPESGLLTVTVMGIILANQEQRIMGRWTLGGGPSPVPIARIIEFKETLQTLIVSSLFIMLAARLRLEDMAQLGWGALAFVLGLILLVRPLSVWLCTLGSALSRQERIFIGWMAPRGIVAASTASIFGLQLSGLGMEGAEQLTPIVFAVVIGTVVVYGLTAGPLAQRLKLSQANPQGTLIVGAHDWARALAHALNKAGIQTLLVDTNWTNAQQARMEGLSVVYGSALSSQTDELLDLTGIGRVLALTSSDEVNTLVALRFTQLFGRAQVYRLPPARTASRMGITHEFSGRFLFDNNLSFFHFQSLFLQGASLKVNQLTPEFDLAAFQTQYAGKAQPLFVVEKSGRLVVSTVDAPLKPQVGQSLVSLVRP